MWRLKVRVFFEIAWYDHSSVTTDGLQLDHLFCPVSVAAVARGLTAALAQSTSH